MLSQPELEEIMGNATFTHLGGSHTLVMGEPKVRPDYGCVLSKDASPCFHRA